MSTRCHTSFAVWSAAAGFQQKGLFAVTGPPQRQRPAFAGSPAPVCSGAPNQPHCIGSRLVKLLRYLSANPGSTHLPTSKIKSKLRELTFSKKCEHLSFWWWKINRILLLVFPYFILKLCSFLILVLCPYWRKKRKAVFFLMRWGDIINFYRTHGLTLLLFKDTDTCLDRLFCFFETVSCSQPLTLLGSCHFEAGVLRSPLWSSGTATLYHHDWFYVVMGIESRFYAHQKSPLPT